MSEANSSRPDPLDSTRILAQFDALRAQRELFYSPTEAIILHDSGIDIDVRIVPSFASKPLDPSAHAASTTRRPPPSDGSDIDHADPAFYVAHIADGVPVFSPSTSNNTSSEAHVASTPGTHKLILNKFCVFRPQYILLTTDPLQRQTTPLRLEDLTAAWGALRAFAVDASQRHYVIYNCGPQAGSSRKHKHMQVLREPVNAAGETIVPLRPWQLLGLDEQGRPTHDVKTVYRGYFVALPHDGHTDMPSFLYEAYADHIRKCRDEMGITDEEASVPHNVVLTREWLVTIPRRAATMEGIEGHVVNAAGMVGLVWVNGEKQLEGWKKTGPRMVLEALGVPA